jgi:hypothetical protein
MKITRGDEQTKQRKKKDVFFAAKVWIETQLKKGFGSRHYRTSL